MIDEKDYATVDTEKLQDEDVITLLHYVIKHPLYKPDAYTKLMLSIAHLSGFHQLTYNQRNAVNVHINSKKKTIWGKTDAV